MDEERQRINWNFPNILAFTTVIICLGFECYAAFVLTKAEVKDNTTLIQIATSISNYILLILTFYFSSSIIAGKLTTQINEMQKSATELALTTANNASNNSSPEATGIKIDKAIAIQKLKTELENLEPDSEEAKALLAQIEELEKRS